MNQIPPIIKPKGRDDISCPIYSPPIAPGQEDMDNLMRTWRYGNFTKGVWNERFEAALKEYLDVEHVILTSSGTLALTVGIWAARKKGYLPSTPKVLMSPYTWTSVGYSLAMCRCVPDFGDIELDKWQLDYDKASQTPGFDAVMLCDTFGARSKVEPEEPYFYNAAHSFGLKNAGQRGLFEAFSMAATKVLTSGEGGFITTSHRDIAEEAREMAGFCGRLPEASAFLGLYYLEHIDTVLTLRRLIHKEYRDRLINEVQYQDDRDGHNYFLTCVRLNENQLDNLMEPREFEVRQYYNPPLGNSCDNVNRICQEVVALPIISEGHCKMVTDRILGWDL